MTNFAAPPPPPPSMSPGATTKAGPGGWVAVAAGVLGLLGLVLPWYAPKLSKPIPDAALGNTDYHAWSGFFFLIIAPVLLILFAVLWFQAMKGKQNSRFAGSADPNRSLALQSIAAGVVAVALGLLSIAIMKNHYKDWDLAARAAKSAGSSLEKNPQFGLYAVLLGGALLIVAGIVGLVMKPAASTNASAQFGAAPGGYPPAGPSASGGFGGQSQGHGPSLQGFGPPQQGFGPPSGQNPAGSPPPN